MYGPENLGPNKCWVHKILDPQKDWVGKILNLKKLWSRQIWNLIEFNDKKLLGPKKIYPEKLCAFELYAIFMYTYFNL